MITVDQLRAMALGRPDESNMASLAVALNAYGQRFGLEKPHRLAHFLAQVLHETGSFRWDTEIWGPTKQQEKYDTGALAKKLGNTPAKDGDGKRYRGRGPFHLTGRANYRAFTKWAKGIDPDAPNFEKEPDAILTDPWEGLSALWYWESRDINRYADDNSLEMVTRAINGGLNGLDSRMMYYGRAALVLLGYGTDRAEIERFQREHPDAGPADGIIGPKTRMALHKALKGRNPFAQEIPVPVPRPTVPETVEEEVQRRTGLWGWLTTFLGGGGAGLTALFGSDWRTVIAFGAVMLAGLLILIVLGPQIVRAIGRIRDAVEGRA